MENIGRYEVIRELGHGAMGRVFLARDPSLERSVALKLLATASDGARQRFHDEAKALAALSHPGIVTIFEVSEHDGQDFIAMEYLAGRTLREVLLDSDPHAHRSQLIAICAKVAVALDAAHRAGILHRDIKPENILVTDAGDVKVVDFGVARRMNSMERHTPRRFNTPIEQRVDELVEAFATTRVLVPGGTDTAITPGTHTVFGTPAYMAPEVLIGELSTEASDVYGLGVTLYECLAGHRPFERASLLELMATVIDGAERPARIDDALAGLVERMLARDRAARPTLVEIAAALTAPPPAAMARRAGRWPAIVGVLAVAAGGVVGWRVVQGRSAPERASTADAHTVIAIEPIAVAKSVAGMPAGGEYAHANALAAAASGISGLVVVGPDEMFVRLKLAKARPGVDVQALSASQLATAERELGAQLVARGSIDKHGGRLVAHLELLPVAGGWPLAVLVRDAPEAELAQLDLDLGEQLARVANPAATFARGSDTKLARFLTTRGDESLTQDAFYEAQLYLEQAVVADPKFFDAWNTLALVREWRFAPEDSVSDAIEQARALAPDERTRQLLTGIGQFQRLDFRAALATLSPLESRLAELDDRQKHDLLYYLGETHWHAGHHAVGVDYFRRVLDLDPRFSPAAIHPAEYALARRDGASSRALSYLQGLHHSESTEFSLGHYEALANGTSAWARSAQIVLGRPTAIEIADDPIGTAAYQLARAVEGGDLAASQSAISDAWKFIDKQGPGPMAPGYFYSLQIFGEVLICAGMADDTRRLVGYLAASSKKHAVGGYPRMLILAAPLLHDKSLVVHDYFTDRLTKLAEASDAELAGDHARAAARLRELVADPGPFWDYPERAALLRNLRALGKTKEASALCVDTLRPAIFRYAFMTVRKLCTTPAGRAPVTTTQPKQR